MAWNRPFGLNTNSIQIQGMENLGRFSVGYPSQGFHHVVGTQGVNIYGGPDETLGYIIVHEDTTGRSTPDGRIAYLGFWRSEGRTESAFLNLVKRATKQTFSTGNAAKAWLHANGYWCSWLPSAAAGGEPVITSGNGGFGGSGGGSPSPSPSPGTSGTSGSSSGTSGSTSGTGTPASIWSNCGATGLVVKVNDGPIGEPVEPLVTYYGSRVAMIYNNVTPSTYQSGTNDYVVNFEVNTYNFPDDRGTDVNCIASATGETSIGVWDLKRGKTNPNNNVVGVDDIMSSGEMMFPSYNTNSNSNSGLDMYSMQNPSYMFQLTYANPFGSGNLYTRTEIRINSVDKNGNDRETQLDQLIGNSGIIKFRQNPKFKTNINTSDEQACWYTVENYAEYRFDTNAFYKVLQSDGSYTYYWSPGAPAGNPTQYNQINVSEPNMGGSGAWTGSSISGSLQRGSTPDGGATTYDGIRPNINVGTIQCNGFPANIGNYVYDFSFDFPLSISIELD